MENTPISEYDILYTEEAVQDIEDKADYIYYHLKSPRISYSWYTRIKKEIQDNLSTFPNKYREFDLRGRRIFISRTDIVLYTVNEENKTVTIESVFTKGKDYTSFTQKKERPAPLFFVARFSFTRSCNPARTSPRRPGGARRPGASGRWPASGPPRS